MILIITIPANELVSSRGSNLQTDVQLSDE